MKIKTFIIDSFTNKPFSGNPAGVCLTEKALDEKTMQSIANELNLSETAFLNRISSNLYSIRYFTPSVEIDFCGHATLASAKLILEKFDLDNVDFITNKNLEISATRGKDHIEMIFPLYETIDYKPSKELLDAFGIENPLSSKFCKELDMVLFEVKDKQDLLKVFPDFQNAINSSNTIKEVVITTKSNDKKYDFYSRCFCPWIGINEDPATGASHSVLAKYWSDKLNKNNFLAYQLSERGGFFDLEVLNDCSLLVKSNAQIVFEGVLSI